MKGLSTILDNKKWVFAYFIVFLMTYLLKTDELSASEYAGVMMLTIPLVIGANSFDKSQWRRTNK